MKASLFYAIASAATREDRVTHSNRYYFGLNRQLSRRDLSRATKLTLYKALILLVLLYDAEARTLSSTDAAALGVFKRVGDDYRTRSNQELYELFNDLDVAKRINIQRFRSSETSV